MKIGGFGPLDVNPYRKSYGQLNKAKNTERQSDKVEISAEALERQVQPSDYLMRQDKIKKLQEQIRNGQYEVDATKVAEKVSQYFSQK